MNKWARIVTVNSKYAIVTGIGDNPSSTYVRDSLEEILPILQAFFVPAVIEIEVKDGMSFKEKVG